MTEQSRDGAEGQAPTADAKRRAVARALADVTTLRVYGALAVRTCSVPELVDSLGLTARDAGAILRRLQELGLVDRRGGYFKALVEAWGELAGDPPCPDSLRPRDIADILTLRPAKRRPLLERLAREFPGGVVISAATVDVILGRLHHDHASLRRYLVEEGLMARDATGYWRTDLPLLPSRCLPADKEC